MLAIQRAGGVGDGVRLRLESGDVGLRERDAEGDLLRGRDRSGVGESRRYSFHTLVDDHCTAVHGICAANGEKRRNEDERGETHCRGRRKGRLTSAARPPPC
jgi:hypothetical protein